MSFRQIGEGLECYFSLECCRKQLDQIQKYVKRLRTAMGWRVVSMNFFFSLWSALMTTSTLPFEQHQKLAMMHSAHTERIENNDDAQSHYVHIYCILSSCESLVCHRFFFSLPKINVNSQVLYADLVPRRSIFVISAKWDTQRSEVTTSTTCALQWLQFTGGSDSGFTVYKINWKKKNEWRTHEKC